jgi:uncharacterized protein (DUF1778 family)
MKQSIKEFSRLEARIGINLHEKIKIVAKAKHLTVSSLITPILEKIIDKELQKIENQAILNLSIQDQKNFANAILSDEEPNQALKQAFKLHKKAIKVK